MKSAFVKHYQWDDYHTMHDIVILSHSRACVSAKPGRWSCNHVIFLMMSILSAIGFDVVLQKDLKRKKEGRVVVNQVDLTVTPPEYAACIESFPNAINGRCLTFPRR
jgi:hypothetical protein